MSASAAESIEVSDQISYASGGRPVMRRPEWPLLRILKPMSRAVICIRDLARKIPGVLKFPTIKRADARYLACKIADTPSGFLVIAADDHIAIHRALVMQDVRRDVVKGG